jgi:Kae1-associated kinase Bud32
MEKLAAGAEAVLYLDRDVIKDRIRKGYRIPEIDERLRRTRTRREAKILDKLSDFPAPSLIETDSKSRIVMEHIPGPKVRDILEKSEHKSLANEIGVKVARLHNKGIIHGDLTTSNMMLNKEVFFIDFGLSFFSEKVEDKAVDLHLLRQALESKHYKVWEECFSAVRQGYERTAKDAELVLKRFEVVESRGRYKRKGS